MKVGEFSSSKTSFMKSWIRPQGPRQWFFNVHQGQFKKEIILFSVYAEEAKTGSLKATPVEDIKKFVSPLLNFQPDPRRQWWMFCEANPRFVYLGQFDNEGQAEVAAQEHRHRNYGDTFILLDYAAVVDIIRNRNFEF